MKKPVVQIVDDDVELVQSFRLLLETMGWEVLTYADGQDFLKRGDRVGPGCIVLDMRIPGMTGLEVQAALEKEGCQLPILFLSAHGSISLAVQTVQHGALDFLEKPVDPMAFVQKVSQAISLSVSRAMEASEGDDFRAKFAKLTPRERDVIEAVIHGAQNKVAARQLGLEVSTIKMHRANAFAKLGVHSQGELIKLAYAAGVVNAEKSSS